MATNAMGIMMTVAIMAIFLICIGNSFSVESLDEILTLTKAETEFCYADKDIGVKSGSKKCIRPFFEDLYQQVLIKFDRDFSNEAYHDILIMGELHLI